MPYRFRIKICGITTAEDALMVHAAGADALGFNFFQRSPRYVPPALAAEIVGQLPRGMVRVGLFVNERPEFVCRMFDQLALDLIQLHGDESPGYLTQLGGRPVMRAFRIGPDGMAPAERYLSECQQLGVMPQLVLTDALVRGVQGGTGQLADWEAIRHYPAQPWHPPLVLAGGLSPATVGDAIAVVRPFAVDVASGVESSPGRKSERLVRSFVQAAREAFGL